jgi:phage FluMu gp28-like protein
MKEVKSALWTPEERLNYADAFIRVDQKPIDLDFWQEAFLCDTHKYSITLKSRRTGFSFAVGLKGLVKAMDPARFKYTRQFVSYNEDDAKEKINYCKEFYHSIPQKYRKPLLSETKTSMEFYDKGGKTTSRLISIACRPPRGRGGDIVFDEMAIYPQNKARMVYTAGLPVTARGGCVEIGSTPLGKIGTFYDIATQPKTFPEYTRYTIPWWFARELCNNVEEAVKLAPHMDTVDRVEIFGTESIKTIYNSMILEDFQQEFECTFIDSAMSYITLDMLYENTPGMREGDRTQELEEGEDEEDQEVKIFKDADSLLIGYNPDKHGRLYLGYDVARRRDAAVIFIRRSR